MSSRYSVIRPILDAANAAAEGAWEGKFAEAAPKIKIAIRIPRYQRGDPTKPFIELFAVVKREKTLTYLAGVNPFQIYVVTNKKCVPVNFRTSSEGESFSFYEVRDSDEDYEKSQFRSAIRPCACELPKSTLESFVAKSVALKALAAAREAVRELS